MAGSAKKQIKGTQYELPGKINAEVIAHPGSLRTLESAWDFQRNILVPGGKATNIFIYPGYVFKAVDALFTNFHTPESTLLMLVAAFAGREELLKVYRHAVDCEYRFFSYGDAMLIQ